jgi:cullin 1
MISATEPKLMCVCEAELLERHETTLLEKEGSGCANLLKNHKKEDLSRMYRLFGRVIDGLLPIAKVSESESES